MTTTADTYFVDVASAVLDDFFYNCGARREQIIDSTIVRYSTDAWFAEVLYLPSDGPNYSPRVEVGSCTELFSDPRRNRVDVMHTAPMNTEEYDYNLRWRYQNRDELKSALTAVRDQILAVYTLPFLNDSSRLQALLNQRRDVVEAEWAAELDEHNDSVFRANAEEAFRNKDFEKVIRCYAKIPPDRRSRIDKSKLRIARNRTS